VPEKKVVFVNIPLNQVASREIIIDNVGGGVNEGTITPTEDWISVSASKIDTRIHRQSFSIRVNTRGLKLAGRYTGRVKIQSRGGSEMILVDLSVEGAEKHARKLTQVATIFAFCLGLAVWGGLAYSSAIYHSYHFYLKAATILIIGLSLFSLTRAHSGYFWLFVAFIGLGFSDFFSMMLFLPGLLTLWFSRPFFNKFPTKTAFAIIIPVLLCGIGWSAGYFGTMNPNFLMNLSAYFLKQSPQKTTTPQPNYETATVQAPQGASIRSGPGVSHARIGVLPHGMRVKIVKRDQGWCQILYGETNRSGFIFHNLLNETPSGRQSSRDNSAPGVENEKSGNTSEPGGDVSAEDVPARFSIQLRSNPPAADLIIQGEFIGKTPLVHQISAGPCEVRLKKEGFNEVVRKIYIEANGAREYNFSLEKAATETEPASPGEPTDRQSGAEAGSGAYDVAPQPIGGYQAIQAGLKYPEIALQQGIEGRVLLHVQISESGKVIGTKVLKSLGKNGCDEAAIAAIQNVHWNPALRNNTPVSVWVAVPVFFKLN
jgi:TonB family protein